MPSAVLLECPTCDSNQVLERKRNDHSKDDFFPIVKNHLRNHPLDESKAAIRKHQITDRTLELIVTPDEFEYLPIGEWRKRTTTWLPEGVSSGVTTSDKPPESPSESPPLQSPTEN